MAQWCCIVLFVSYLIAPCLLEHRHTTPRPRPAELGIYNSQTEIGHNITEILNEFFKSGYDKRIRPNYAGPPVEVGVTMHIICISSVSEVQMDFTSDFYFRQAWRDPRLAFKPRPGIEALFVGAEVAERIWNPDTFFANEKSAQFHLATTPNTFIRIGVNGDVLRSTRLTVTSACAMNLQYFPMDRQMCTIEVESYGYSMADIMYKWSKEKAVGMSEVVELPQFNIQGLKQRSKVEILSTGNYSRLVCEIEFVRSMGYYLIQIYIPASLIVIISWVSFWLHRNASPARVQLGVTTVLTMTTLMSSTNAALPKISYIKSIDVFLGTCFVMVFASLLEYATVGYMGKRIAMRKSRIQQIAKMKIAHRTLQSAEMGNAVGHQTHLPSQHHTICITNEHATHSSMRNSISHAPEVRYRLVGNATTAAGGPSEAAGPCGPDRGRASVDYTRRKLSMAQMMDSEDNEDSGGREGERTSSSPPPSMPGNKNLNTLFGVSPSDIDKYSRVVFPVCFLCFNLMYWIIYMHISEFLTEEFEE